MGNDEVDVRKSVVHQGSEDLTADVGITNAVQWP
jgi:hypothetical protein